MKYGAGFVVDNIGHDSRWFAQYQRTLDTVELNAPFYHWPRLTTATASPCLRSFVAVSCRTTTSGGNTGGVAGADTETGRLAVILCSPATFRNHCVNACAAAHYYSLSVRLGVRYSEPISTVSDGIEHRGLLIRSLRDACGMASHRVEQNRSQ